MRARSFRFPLTVCSIVGVCLATSAITFPQPAPPDELWKLVAQSHVIVVGTPSVPAAQIEHSERSGQHDYVAVPVRVKECLKGDPCPKTIVVRYFTRTAWYSPAPRTLVESSGNQSVLFLIQVDTQTISGAPEIYFAGHTPKAIQPYSEELIRQVRVETLAQKQIIDDFARNFRPEDEPSHVKVRSLIEATLHRRSEKRAFAELEALGEAAVPAMIMSMDDRRELPVKEISLRNGPGGLEPFRVYGPKVVADAIAAILSQITQEDFGTIVHGGSERERKAAIDGWRVYLHRKRFGEHNPTADSSRATP
jgi:hypothetical protein